MVWKTANSELKYFYIFSIPFALYAPEFFPKAHEKQGQIKHRNASLGEIKKKRPTAVFKGKKLVFWTWVLRRKIRGFREERKAFWKNWDFGKGRMKSLEVLGRRNGFWRCEWWVVEVDALWVIHFFGYIFEERLWTRFKFI